MTIKIVIADDHPVVRKGLSLLLSSQDEFEVIGEAANGEEATAKVSGSQSDHPMRRQ